MNQKSLVRIGISGLLALSASLFAFELATSEVTKNGGDQGTVDRLDRLEQQLVRLIQGDAVPVAASPALCAALGYAVKSAEQGSTKWYFGTPQCDPLYPPSTTAIVTAATRGLSKRLHESPLVTAELNEVLRQLATVVVAERIAPERKLRLHSTAWELGVGLTRSLEQHPERQEFLLATVCESFELLRRTRFTDAEAADLSSTLEEVSKVVDRPSLGSVIEAIRRRDSGVIEVYPTSNSHAEALLGRFSSRIFLTLADKPERLARVAANHRAFALVDLPQKLDGLIAVLVLYFNVVTHNNAIVATEHVAGLQAYEYSRRTSFDIPFREAGKLLDFTTVIYEREYGGRDVVGEKIPPVPEFRYQKLSPQSIALEGFVDAKPAIGGLPATTLRGNCLGCHVYRVETFNTPSDRVADLTVPFVHPPSDLVVGYTLKEIQPQIQRQLERCPGGNKLEATEKSGER